MEFNNQYLTYREYMSLGGTLSHSAFNLLEYEARKKIDKETFGRLIDLTTQVQEVKLCVNQLVGVLNENRGTIKSVSVDGYSITRIDGKDLEKVYSNIVREYLSECKLADGTPYLYRG